MLDYLPIFMFAALLALILLGFPVAFTLSGTSFVFALIGYHYDVFAFTDLGFVLNRIWGVMGNFTLVAVPLFVFMGILLEKSGIAEELILTTARLLKRLKGSLALTVVLVGMVLAASTGIVGATVVTMGVLCLPAMLKSGYGKDFACGTIAASGTLGQIIPPSIVLVLLGDIMNVDVGDLFLGALLPGGILVGAYLLFTGIFMQFRPFSGETASVEQLTGVNLTLWGVLKVFAPPLLLVSIVLGSILFGVASPTEAAACGAFGAMLISIFKKKLNWKVLYQVGEKTAITTSMVFTLLIGAQFFGVVFRGLYGDELIGDLVNEYAANKNLILLSMMVLVFVLGFFLDFLEICFIIVPIILPTLIEMDFPLLWVAILLAINLQTSFLTPPFGFALFYLKGVAPKTVSTMDLYRGILPFVVIQLAVLVLIYFYPELVLWLPEQVFSN